MPSPEYRLLGVLSRAGGWCAWSVADGVLSVCRTIDASPEPLREMVERAAIGAWVIDLRPVDPWVAPTIRGMHFEGIVGRLRGKYPGARFGRVLMHRGRKLVQWENERVTDMPRQDWEVRHERAMAEGKNRFTHAMSQMLEGWNLYAEAHRREYDSPIGEDGVLGEHWQEIGAALRGLLNGDCGPGVDCGTLDREISRTLERNGCDPNR